MRLFDKLLIQKPIANPFKADRLYADPNAITVICADDFAGGEVAIEENDECLSPWGISFTEWHCPPAPQSLNSAGVLCIAGLGHDDASVFGCGVKDAMGSDEWLSVMYPCYELNGAVRWSAVGIVAIFSPNRTFSRIFFLAKPTYSDISQEFNDLLLLTAQTALSVFKYANCQNAVRIDVTEDVQPPAKIRRRFSLPEIKRYTLKIGKHFKKPSYRARDSIVHGIMPRYLCRGHFATYTKDAPLFGKYIGRFWIPPHAKGKKENGEIQKDYVINTSV